MIIPRAKINKSSLCAHVTGPAQSPRVDKVHGAAVPAYRGRVCLGKIMVETMGTAAQPHTRFVWNGASVPSQYNRQRSKDR